MPEAPPASEVPGRTGEFHPQDNRFVVERHAKRVSSEFSLLETQFEDRDILTSWQLLDHVCSNISKPDRRLTIISPKDVIYFTQKEVTARI